MPYQLYKISYNNLENKEGYFEKNNYNFDKYDYNCYIWHYRI